jgi:hypothetical protein
MNLENTSPYSFNLPITTLASTKPGAIETEASDTEPQTPRVPQPRDSFVGQNSNNQEVLVAGLPTWHDTGKAIGDLWNGEFKAYKLSPLVGGDTKKAKEITDHLNFLNSGDPSTVTIGFDKTLVDQHLDQIDELSSGESKNAIPNNLYVITADANGNLTASQPSSGTIPNVVGVALKNPDNNSIDIIRITRDSKIGLRKGTNGNALFSTATQLGSVFILKTIK